jgi:PRTRC genetic system protein B
MAVSPFWNLSDSGLLCTGSMRCPSGVSISMMKAWEKGFYESAFTHANVGRTTRHTGGFEVRWGSLAGKRTRFPADALIPLAETLSQFVRTERY